MEEHRWEWNITDMANKVIAEMCDKKAKLDEVDTYLQSVRTALISRGEMMVEANVRKVRDRVQSLWVHESTSKHSLFAHIDTAKKFTDPSDLDRNDRIQESVDVGMELMSRRETVKEAEGVDSKAPYIWA